MISLIELLEENDDSRYEKLVETSAKEISKTIINDIFQRHSDFPMSGNWCHKLLKQVIDNLKEKL